jgi:glycosyltransferase involved in cell wall biosynthesis
MTEMRQRALAIPLEAVIAPKLAAPIRARRFAFLSFRPFASDFRRYLIAGLQEAGYPCAHILLKRSAMEIRTGPLCEVVSPVARLGELTRHIDTFLASGRGVGSGVIVNSAGNSAPDVILRLWAGLHRHLWIYDVFDELRYDARGIKRLQWWVTDRAYRSTAVGCCLLSPDLVDRYASAFHLDNASHLGPSKRRHSFDGRAVVTASFDRRTDFALLDAIARAMPDLTIDLYGAIYDNEPDTVAEMGRLVAAHRNIRYHGRFEMQRIGDLLADYAVGLVPYRADFSMTRFINPDKLFHYLCAGLEVVASPIPAIRRFAPYLYEAADAPAVIDALRRIRDGERRNPCNLHKSFNWRHRAEELLDFVERVAAGGLPRP